MVADDQNGQHLPTSSCTFRLPAKKKVFAARRYASAVYTALCLSVCLSVCLSHCKMVADDQNGQHLPTSSCTFRLPAKKKVFAARRYASAARPCVYLSVCLSVCHIATWSPTTSQDSICRRRRAPLGCRPRRFLHNQSSLIATVRQ